MTSKKEIISYLKKAGEMALHGGLRRNYLLGAIAVRSDGAVVQAFNGETIIPIKNAHAERRVAAKCDVGSTVYVARVLRGGGFANARPCVYCMSALQSRGISKIYFTINAVDFGVEKF